MNAAEQLGSEIGIAPACRSLGLPRSSFYREMKPAPSSFIAGPVPRKPSPRALSPEEEEKVLEILNSPRFMNDSPRQVYATLLDEGEYWCSVSTMYRILSKRDMVLERRNQRTHPPVAVPRLVAIRANQVWTWDITKLPGPKKGMYYSLYVILDIYSRYVVGWMVAERESATYATRLINETFEKQDVQAEELTLHSDRGAPMTAKMTVQLLADLGITKTHSRPRTSNDNAFSESQFKTMKYRPEFPERFGSLEDAIAFCREFFTWYNRMHHHTGLGLLTPEQVHYGHTQKVIDQRNAVLAAAYAAHPERFVGKPPKATMPPREVWINKPTEQTLHLVH